jgi:phytoene synthase
MSNNSKVMRKHGKTFFWASRFLDKKVATRLYAIYKFCREVDDLIDQKNKGLNYEEKLKKNINGWRSSKKNLIFQPFFNIEKNFIPGQILFNEFFNGQESDIRQKQPISMNDLLIYCYRVAGIVGLMICDTFGIKDQKLRYFAIDLGIAMQLTNIARDIYEDAENNRIYIPVSLIGEKKPKDLLGTKADERLLINKARDQLINKSDLYYESGFRGVSYLPNKSQRAVRVAATLYQCIGRKIQTKKVSYDSHRVHLNTFEKLYRTIFILKNNKMHMKQPSEHNHLLHYPIKTMPGAHR